MLNIKSKKIYIKFLLSYILILLLALIIAFFIYEQAVGILKKHAFESSLASLEQGRNVLEKRLEDIKNMSIQLSMDQKVLNLMNPVSNDTSDLSMYDVMQAQSSISTYRITNNFINSYSVYLKEPKVILSNYASSIDEKYYYDRAFRYGQMSYNEWFDLIMGKRYTRTILPSNSVVINNQERSMLTYLQSIPIDGVGKPKGVVAIFFDSSEIYNVFNSLFAQNCDWVCIYDSSGNVVTYLYDGGVKDKIDFTLFSEQSGYLEEYISGEKTLISYTTSANNGWKYVAGFPYDSVMVEVNNSKRTFLYTIIVFLSMGIIAASYFAHVGSKPLSEIIGTLVNQRGNNSLKKGSEYEFINNSIIELIMSNRISEDEISRQMPLLRASFFDRLFNGRFATLEEALDYSKYIKINIPEGKIVALIIDIASVDNAEVTTQQFKEAKAAIKAFVSNNLLERGYSYDLCVEKTAILLFLSNEYEAHILNIISKLEKELFDKLDIRFNCSIGGIHDNIMQAEISLNEANQAMEYSFLNRVPSPVWYPQIPKSSTGFYYPINVEQRLINLVLSGGDGELKEMLNEIFDENINKRKLSSFMSKQLLYNIRCTLIKILNNSKFDLQTVTKCNKRLQNVDKDLSTPDIYEMICSIFYNLCNSVEEQKKSHNTELKNSLIEYLHLNYSDSNLYLPKIAEYFGVSEVYISNFFKEQTGVTITQYTEMLRLEAAKKLLGENIRIKDIAPQVGYTSVQVFRRAFKRVFGINPANYSQEILDQGI